MNRFRTKSIMLLVIYSTSIFLFALSYNVCFHADYVTVKDSAVLSNTYANIHFEDNKPSVEQLNRWAGDAKCHYIMTASEYSQGRTVAFSEMFFHDLGIEVSSLAEFEENEAVAVVNEDALYMCHETEDGLYLKIQGISYRVIATYQEMQDDIMNETFYYLNQNAERLQQNNAYDYVILEPLAGSSLETLSKQFSQEFEGVSVSKWDGDRTGTLNNRLYFKLVTMIVSILLCINCIGFSNEWMKAQIQELGIRKLVGATDGQNHLLILRRFGKLFMISFGIGILMAVAALALLRNAAELSATREMFGKYVYGKSILFSAASVGMVGGCMTEYSLFFLKKRNLLMTIRGGR